MQRARWSSRTIFLFAAIGSAVGLGNVWRFPYLAHKFGGGAFLIPYLIALLILGIPLLILEFAVGQKLQKGAVDAFKTVHYKLSGIGYGALFAAFIVVVYYAAVMAWALVYLINSFQSKLPWSVDPSGYFFNGVLQISDGIGNLGGINWLLFTALAAIWITIYFCVRGGVKSVGKVVAITMPLPLILLSVLFIRGITLNGAASGIYYYLAPNFSALLSTEIWIAAASQIFFTLSLAFGIMIAYASYNHETQDILGDAYITSITNSLISIFAGFVVFSVLGYMATTTGAPIEEVVAAGPGLAFVVFPQALSLMPFGNIFAILFFLTLLTLGIDSAFSLVEAVNTAIMDRKSSEQLTRAQKQKAIKKIAAIVCSAAFILGILFTTKAGLYYLDIIDHFITNFALIMFGILECLAIGWIYGAEKMRTYINSTSSIKLGTWWNYAIKYFIPIILSLLVLAQLITETQGPYEGYPGWAILLGWLSVAIPILLVAIPLIWAKQHSTSVSPLLNATKDIEPKIESKKAESISSDQAQVSKSVQAPNSVLAQKSNSASQDRSQVLENSDTSLKIKEDTTQTIKKLPPEESIKMIKISEEQDIYDPKIEASIAEELNDGLEEEELPSKKIFTPIKKVLPNRPAIKKKTIIKPKSKLIVKKTVVKKKKTKAITVKTDPAKTNKKKSIVKKSQNLSKSNTKKVKKVTKTPFKKS